MHVIDWKSRPLAEGILAELVRDDNRIVLWLPGARDREFQYWERIGTTPRAQVQAQGGIHAVLATSTPVRQRTGGGLLGRLTRKLTGGGDDFWVLPNGKPAERCGERRTDLLLVWPQNDATLDEAQVRSRWPASTRHQKIGEQFFMVEGTNGELRIGGSDLIPSGVQGTDELGCPTALAEQLLEVARQSGDRSREAAALIDLGIVVMNDGDLNRAVATLQKAVNLTRELGDLGREADALNNLGYALLAMGQTAAARQVLEAALALCRKIGDTYTEKLVLERLGLAYANLRDPARALGLLHQALRMTRAANDRQQETRILWTMAIAHADLGQREVAIEMAEESVALLRILGKPEASWYGAQLQRYRMDLAALAATGPGNTVSTAGPNPDDTSTGPGLLRMAVSATRAMMRFIGTGLKASAPDVQRTRMSTCQACEHHTGLRCRICGCFTNVKTRMAHEQCPIGKWPA